MSADTKRLLIDCYNKNKEVIFFFLAIVVACIVYYAPLPETISLGDKTATLTHQGRITMTLLSFAIVLWVTEATSFAVTALLAMTLMPLLGATEGLEVVRDGNVVALHGAADGLSEMIKIGFGNNLIFFFLGVFLLTGAFIKSGLGERLVLLILRVVGAGTRMVVLGFLVMGTVLSMWVTDMAVSALMTPLGVALLKSSNIKPLKSNFGRALMIACCWGGVFGGIGTPAGCGPNPIAMEYLRKLAGIDLSFVDWMKIGVPASLILVPVGWLVLILLFPPEMKRLPFEQDEIKHRLEKKGPLSKAEWVTVSVFALVITLWVGGDFIESITGGSVMLSMEMVALMGGLVFFLPGIGIMTWEEAEPLMNWDAIVLVMASLALGLMMYKTGAARWLSWILLGNITAFSPVIQIALVIAAVMFMKLFLASNTVTGIIVIPLLITLANDLGLDAWFLVAPAAFTASLGIILLTQSPTNIIPYTSGYFSVKDFALSGIVMTVIMIVLLTLVISVIGPLMGIYHF
ncbi:MAG: DASS family sodium-coupled anion symporter [Deltaproteobacteria bacterium]|nr:DASS family sodium-coupled anion symporter [Candidatus Zymogenaceae bacterium]